MATPRVSRGRRIQALATIYFQQNGWVQAENTPASLPGKDVTGMPGWAPEVKGTRDNPLPAALRQAAKNAEPGETPLVVWCPDGYGEAKIDDWVVAFRFKDAVELMRMAEGFEAAADAQLAEVLEDRDPGFRYTTEELIRSVEELRDTILQQRVPASTPVVLDVTTKRLLS
jgi:hypothetical protein